MDSPEKPTVSTSPEPASTPTPPAQNSKLGKVKLGFLYVLIGGLVVSAIISVVAILIGEFNSVIQKALLTTLLLVLHSCIALLIVLADTRNQLGKSVIPTTILGTVIANMITSSLGIWGVLGDDLAYRLVNVYALLVGAAFIVAGITRLKLNTQALRALTVTTTSLVLLLTLALIPWVLFFDSSWISDLYYRFVGAAAILAVTALIITCIINRIAVAQKPELAKTAPATVPYSGGMLAVVITFGTIISFFWLYGLGSFIYLASNRDARTGTPAYEDPYYYNSYNNYNTY